MICLTKYFWIGGLKGMGQHPSLSYIFRYLTLSILLPLIFSFKTTSTILVTPIANVDKLKFRIQAAVCTVAEETLKNI